MNLVSHGYLYYIILLVLINMDIYDHESLVKAIRQVVAVISTVGPEQLADQLKVIDAINEAGNVKEGISYR